MQMPKIITTADAEHYTNLLAHYTRTLEWHCELFSREKKRWFKQTMRYKHLRDCCRTSVNALHVCADAQGLDDAITHQLYREQIALAISCANAAIQRANKLIAQ